MVEVNPDLGGLSWHNAELGKRILHVHHVKEGEFGVQAHRWEDLVESAMRSVLGIGVARAD